MAAVHVRDEAERPRALEVAIDGGEVERGCRPSSPPAMRSADTGPAGREQRLEHEPRAAETRSPRARTAANAESMSGAAMAGPDGGDGHLREWVVTTNDSV